MLIQHFLEKSVADFGDKLALIHGQNRISYGQIYQDAVVIAQTLRKEGLLPGERVAIFSDTPHHYIAAYFGILISSGIVVGLNTQTSARSIEYTISDCTPAFVLISGSGQKYSKLMSSLPPIRGTLDINLLLEQKDAPSDQELPTNSLGQDSEAQIIYTSGSTGKPKGVVLTHRNLVSNTLSTNEYLRLTQNDTLMAVLPFFYSYGNSLLLTHIAAGGCLVVNQSFVYPNLILDQMAEEKVTGLSGVPSTFALLLHRSALRDYSFPFLRYLTQAGAAMSPKLAGQLHDVFPNTEIFIMYGQTEAAPRLSYLPPTEIHIRPGSIGKAVPGVTLEILKPDGSKAKVNEIGEIVASGPNIMRGYWKKDQETKKVLREGKLWTGDLAYSDEEGFLYIVSRKSDLIKSGSHRIAPTEIEEILLEIEGIIEAAVVGAEDAILGEKIIAYLVLSSDLEVSEKTVIKYCRKNLPTFKVPHQICFVPDLPKTSTGKIQKSALIKLYKE